MVRMSKDELQKAPAFKRAGSSDSGSGSPPAGGGTSGPAPR
jgi:hypothetical protein